MYRDALPIAAGRHFRAGVEVDVGAEEKVEMTVAIVIDKRAAGAPLRRGQRETRFASDVGERPVAVVAKEHVAIIVSEEQIIEAIVVVVADGDARHPAGTSEAGFRGDVEKRSITIVFVEPIAGSSRSCAEARAAQDKNVEPAVVIVVEEGDAATDGFENMMFGVDGSINTGRREPGFAGDIGKLGVERKAGALAALLRANVARGHALGEQRGSQRAVQHRSSSDGFHHLIICRPGSRGLPDPRTSDTAECRPSVDRVFRAEAMRRWRPADG